MLSIVMLILCAANTKSDKKIKVADTASVDIKNLINSITGNNATADSIQELSDRIDSITGNIIDIKNTFTEREKKAFYKKERPFF